MDIVLVGGVLFTARLVYRLVTGSGVDATMLILAALFYGLYAVAAMRLGVSPIGYLKDVGRRHPR